MPNGEANTKRLPFLWVLATLAFLGAIYAIYLGYQKPDTAPPGAGDLISLLGIAIGAVALVATVGFLVLAYPIWSELAAIEDERAQIAQDRQKTLDLRREVDEMMSDLNHETEDLRRKIEILSAPNSRYTGVYDSLKLFSTVIRYIGVPLWGDEDRGLGDEAEAENERVDRHVSLVQQLMAAMAVEPEKDPAQYLSFMRDAVGHLRKNDDEIFFDFIDTRLKVIQPVDASLKEVHRQIKYRFQIIKGLAAEWRLNHESI